MARTRTSTATLRWHSPTSSRPAPIPWLPPKATRGLARDARQLLGGDAIVSSDQPAPPAFVEKARELGLTTATTAGFPSMGRATEPQGGASRLVSVKAVSDSYPLRGRVTVSGAAGGKDELRAGAPERGTVWVDAALLGSLNLKVGDTLLLGDASLRIERRIVNEPDRGTGFASLAPRVMLNEADLPATGLIQPASRVNYRLAVATFLQHLEDSIYFSLEVRTLTQSSLTAKLREIGCKCRGCRLRFTNVGAECLDGYDVRKYERGN